MRYLDSFPVDVSVPKAAMTTDDPSTILRFAADSLDAGRQVALVTLVDIRGGAARSLGSQMAVRDDAAYCGYVSGGCTEAAIATEAVLSIKAGIDRYLQLGEGSPFFDIVLPCGGGITVCIHVLRDNRSLNLLLSHLQCRERVALAYEPKTQSLSCVRLAGDTGWQDDVFVTHYRPKPRLVVSGGGIEVETTARLAIASGYDVLVETLPERLSGGDGVIDEDTAVAILHHDLDRELPLLRRALAAKPFYIGALGSSRTHERRREALLKMGYEATDIARIKAPIGIFPKAKDSSSLALSVLADIAMARTVVIARDPKAILP